MRSPDEYPLRPVGPMVVWLAAWLLWALGWTLHSGWQLALYGGPGRVVPVVMNALAVLLYVFLLRKEVRRRLRSPEQVRADRLREYEAWVTRELFKVLRRNERAARRSVRAARRAAARNT